MARALVVDDSGIARHIARLLLGELGFDVVEAASAAEALRALASNAPQVMLVDWHMPEVDGPTLVRTMREDHAYDRVRVMMVTSENTARGVVLALSLGADEFLMKPYTREMLASKLAILGFGGGPS
jgi:two-component system chemotaxis response regulator CheY